MVPLPPPLPLTDEDALFLDFDGTLVELAETPDRIRVPPALEPLLRRLRRKLEGRLAIVSGRSIADLERHLPNAGIAFSGSHGLELRFAGGAALPLSVPAGIDDVRERARAFAAATEGLIAEDKPAGVALHYRQAPDAETRVLEFAAGLARRHGFAVQPGKMVAELVPRGATKGDALRAFMTEPEFANARPLFVGDDLTDEHGFTAAAALSGAGILVGAPRATAAAYRLPSAAAVRDWLERAL
jgi:trehalose 6-phosphate phosphatase